MAAKRPKNRRQEMPRERASSPVAALVALLVAAMAALAGCLPEKLDPARFTTGPALTVSFTAPDNARIGELQQALADGRQPWRNDPFLVARAEFLGLLASPPEMLDEQQLGLLRSIDRAAVEKTASYEMDYDAAKRVHIVFAAPPFSVDATMALGRANSGPAAVWITHDVVLTPLPRRR